MRCMENHASDPLLLCRMVQIKNFERRERHCLFWNCTAFSRLKQRDLGAGRKDTCKIIWTRLAAAERSRRRSHFGKSIHLICLAARSQTAPRRGN